MNTTMKMRTPSLSDADWSDHAICVTIPATIEAKIRRETPLVTPFSVSTSPNQSIIIAPTASTNAPNSTIVRLPVSITPPPKR